MPDDFRDLPTRCCAAVDAGGTGRFLPAALARHGMRCIHVQSPDMLPDPGSPAVDLHHDGDLVATAGALREYGVDSVIAGTESGVELADALAGQLGLPGNGMRNPRARRNKYEMALAVQRAGLAIAEMMHSGSADDLVSWATARDEWPVVLKPTESSGADQVIVCFDAGDVRAAREVIMTRPNKYGRRNKAVLAQEFLKGDEYFINTISRDRVHYVAEIWCYHKRWVQGNRVIYDYESPLAAADPVAVELAAYTLAVLDALEIHNGAAHTEVMRTAAGPVLIDCGARLCGSQLPDMVSRCFGTSQLELTALSIARPAEFELVAATPFDLKTHARYVSLISPRPGVVPSEAALQAIYSLPTFGGMKIKWSAGQSLPETVDLATSPGYVYLVSDQPDGLERDYRRLRELEAGPLYAASAASAAPAWA